MEDLFRKVYRGDPGVPHSDPDRYLHSWLGSFAFAAVSWCTSRTADLSRRFKYVVSFCLSVSLWHDKALKFEHNHWKKVMEKKHCNGDSP
ncbi:hypothetical protein B296_00037807 [Ensete ventricosum]|uniref:Uncharacterized protein n=1 Tax=Ensete ventricosum TaxID=4639 RepID=A0A426XQY8_ENSVE|nr:hypothetical protein B296_00037807 [Ensete ventricosum]